MEEEDYVEPCSICLEDLIPENKEEAENLGILSCNHKFHEACIKLWSEKACTCPIDRGEFSEIKIYNCNDEYLSTFVIKKKNKEAEIEIEDLSFCTVCGSSEHEEIMLLCDICDAPYHTSLTSIPLGNWYCPNCVSENPALASSMFQDDESEYTETPLIYETVPTTQAGPSTRKRTRSSGGTRKKTTRKGRGKKATSRTVANSSTRIRAPRSVISKLRKEIIKRRQDNMIANRRLLTENVLIDIPYSFSDYVDAYRASSSDNKSTRSLSSLREKLNYDVKTKYSKMLDTKTVNNIYDKSSSYNRKSEYDLIWRQASLAKKFKTDSNSSIMNHSLNEKDAPSTSFKRPNIALRKMKEQETIKNNDKSSVNTQNQPINKNFQTFPDYTNFRPSTYNNNDNVSTSNSFKIYDINKTLSNKLNDINGLSKYNNIRDNNNPKRPYSPHSKSINDYHSETDKNKYQIISDRIEPNNFNHYNSNDNPKNDRNKNHSSAEHSRLYNTYHRFSSNNNLNKNNYRSSTEDSNFDDNKYQTSPEIHNTDFHLSNSNRVSSSINRILFNNPSDDTKKNRTSNSTDYRFDGKTSNRNASSNSRYHPYKRINYDHPPINRSTSSLNDHPHINIKEKSFHESDSEPELPKDNNNKEFSSREILRYLKPYLKKK
ncbi:hypothetical protein PIROE2DRAFT_58846 [Piromyces sp. E2]|nr:hypothetical protein PIROE2DRAFT_58846 [Piromyces sp. E2]|eukprot:OUM67295.1 hypothetical protein PIROE2DRAFT_58846 [Piromyces sp. E2]